MGNHCENRLYVVGDLDLLAKFDQDFRKDGTPRFLNALPPENGVDPEIWLWEKGELEEDIDDDSMIEMDTSGHLSHYFNQWGNAYNEPCYFYEFYTDHMSALNIVEKIALRYPDLIFDLQYDNLDDGFSGHIQYLGKKILKAT
ncbi:MAG: hypothetical protein HPY53_01530 [Brevinematales bacterium]|nr:hypothetical protein [Brevinematales bacterium]